MSQRLTVTLDDETYSYLKEQAERDYRTIGAEICYLLHLHVPAPITRTEPFIKPTHTPENPTGQSHTPTNTIVNSHTDYNADYNTYYTKSGKRTVIE